MLGPVHQAPDDLMQVPLTDLLFKAARRVDRMQKLVAMMSEAGGAVGTVAGPVADQRMAAIEAVAERERTLCQVAAIALRARAREVCRLCDSIGLTNSTPTLVRDRPLDVALAIRAFLCRRRRP